jgi:hypothetical protein
LAALSTRVLDLVDRHLGDLQAVGHVREHAHVRVQRVVLEHHGDVALGRFELVHHLVADGDLAGRDFLEAGDHAQQRGFAAARGADDHDEFMPAPISALDAVDDLQLLLCPWP